MMATPTLYGIEDAIRAGHDELYGMADYLGVDPTALGDVLAEAREKRLLYRYVDRHEVSRHGICGEGKAAA